MFKFLLIALLGFASGLPLALTGSTLQAWSTDAGLSLMTIGTLSLVAQAYAFKFLWAPLTDRVALPLVSGLRRGWLLWCQVALALGLAAMALCPMPQQFVLMVMLAALVALFSATYDTVFDAFRIEYFDQKDYGLANAVYVTAYRTAMLVSGGLAMVAAAYLGWRWVYGAMAGLALCSAAVCCWVPIVPRSATVQGPQHGWIEGYRRLFKTPQLAWILVFIVLYKFGEAFGTALSTSFLLRVGHFSLVQIGFTYKTCGLAATLSGSFIGAFAYRYGRLKDLLLLFGLLQAASLAFYLPIAAGQHTMAWMITAVVAEAGCAGMATTVFVAFLMRLCDKNHVATQFAVLAALSSIGRIVTGPLAAFVIDHVGWWNYYWLAMLICVPALLILLRIKMAGVAVPVTA